MYDEFCKSVLEDDYTQVDASHSGQVVHGNNDHLDEEKAAQAKSEEEQAMVDKQDRLNQLIEIAREQLAGRDCSDAFMAADERQDGHCSYDGFAQLLLDLGLDLEEGDVELFMESFFDPDHPDQ